MCVSAPFSLVDLKILAFVHNSLFKLNILCFICARKSLILSLDYFTWTLLVRNALDDIFFFSLESWTFRRKYRVFRKKFIRLMRHFLSMEYHYRMSHDNSQLGRVTSESSPETNRIETNIDQLLTIDVATTDLSPSEVETTTAIVVNTTSQVPNGTLVNTPTTRQRARRRQRDRQVDISHQHQQHQRQRRNGTPKTLSRNRSRVDYTLVPSTPRRLEENS